MADIISKRLVVIALGLGLASCKGDSPPGPGPVPPQQPPVVSLAPTAAFTAVATANALEPVTFDASASASKDGSALQYVWDFGNGQRGGGRTITRTFGTGGARSVTLTVVDTANRSASQSKSVTVNPPPAPTSMVTAHGVVKGLDGKGIAGVLVAAVGGASGVTTDTAGKASMSLGTGTPLTLRFTRAGYADQVLALRLPTRSGTDAYFEVVMRTRDAALTLTDAALGGTLTGRDGAVLTLPPNALVNSAGAAVTGAVQIAITPVDPTQSGGGGFPGGFDGLQQSGTSTPIVSFGTTEYVLTAGGQSVQVAPGKRAAIELPLYGIKKLNGTLLVVGDSTPLWSLDESTGMWVQEGTGTVVSSATSPSGLALRATVAHFSWWNADIGFDPYGPQPKCVYDTDIGIPGANNTFATATICNMLAEIDNGLASPRIVGAVQGNSPAAATPRFAGFAVRRTVPIAGGETIPVPAGVNISLKATALNGTWGGNLTVNGPVGVQAEATIKMRPLFTIAGPTPEAITLPFDGTRSLAPLQSTALFTFAGVAQKFARVVVAPAPGSILTGRVRLLQGSAVLGSAAITTSSTQIVAPLPANATFTVEIIGDAAAAFRLQVELLGGVQEQTLTLPTDVTITFAPYFSFRGSVTVAAPTTISLARTIPPGLGVDVRVVSSTGTVLLDGTGLPDSARSATLTLPAAGTYAVELRPRSPTQATLVRLTMQQTLWVQIAPTLDQGGVYNIIDAQADKNGKLVVGYVEQVGLASRLKLQRWTGVAWEAAAGDLLIDKPCGNGGSSFAFAFDNANRPVVLSGNKTDPSTATFLTARRYGTGAWQAIGPNDGTLPLRSGFGGACGSTPALAIGADDAPVVAYGYDNNIVVQRFDGTKWRGLVAPDSTGDVFPLQNPSYDLKVDATGRVWFVTGSPTFSNLNARVRRFDVGATKWDTIGGFLPQTNTSGLAIPRLRFDASGQPVIGWVASVGTGGVAGPGVGVYRYDGTVWSTTGGYNPAGTRASSGNNDLGFTLFNGEALVSWTSVNDSRGSLGVIVQRNTAAGWTPIGSANGDVPPYTYSDITALRSYSSKLVPIGDQLYMVLISNGDLLGGGVSKLVLLRKVPN